MGNKRNTKNGTRGGEWPRLYIRLIGQNRNFYTASHRNMALFAPETHLEPQYVTLPSSKHSLRSMEGISSSSWWVTYSKLISVTRQILSTRLSKRPRFHISSPWHGSSRINNNGLCAMAELRRRSFCSPWESVENGLLQKSSLWPPSKRPSQRATVIALSKSVPKSTLEAPSVAQVLSWLFLLWSE